MTLPALLAVAVLTAADEAPVEPPPNWSAGGGFAFTALSGFISFGGTLSAPSVPTATLAFERRLTGRTWLMFGLRGGVAQDSYKPETDQTSMATSVTSVSSQSVFGSLGVRQSLLSERAWVDVMFVAILSYGYQRSVQSLTVTQPQPLGEPMVTNSNTVSNLGTVGLGLGLAAERRLIENLALRLTLGLAKVSYSAGRASGNGLGGLAGVVQSVSNISAGIVLEPGLELRFYF